jgi:hypothetical protein
MILVDYNELQWDINQNKKEFGKSSEMVEGFCFVVSVTGLSMRNNEFNYKRFGFMEHMIQL